MTEDDRLARLMHSANNCRQMLGAIDRRLARAIECLEKGGVENCREHLKALEEALPQAMAIIEFENDNAPDQAAASSSSAEGHSSSN